jgi:uncharacterized membrane protein (DUF373 family)
MEACFSFQNNGKQFSLCNVNNGMDWKFGSGQLVTVMKYIDDILLMSSAGRMVKYMVLFCRVSFPMNVPHLSVFCIFQHAKICLILV